MLFSNLSFLDVVWLFSQKVSSNHVLGSFTLARVTGRFFVGLKLFSNGNCPLDWNLNSMFHANPLLQRNIQSDMIYIFKNT